MRTDIAGGIRFTFPDANIWLQERLLVYCHKVSGAATAIALKSAVDASESVDYATYKLDSNGDAIVDITDYARANFASGSTNYMYICAKGAGTANIVTMDFAIAGMINPKSVCLPDNALSQQNALIIPPTKLLAPADWQPVLAEFYDPNGATGWDTNTTAAAITNGRYLEIAPTDASFYLRKTGIGGDSKTYRLTRPLCDKRYCFVRWVSFTGIVRQHMFEVIKPTTEAAKITTFEPIDNDYKDMREREDSLTLRLTGLDMYDFWYYSDLITSQKVEICRPETPTTWERVQVTTKSVTQPDGAAFDGKLDITIKWKHYDAIAMQ